DYRLCEKIQIDPLRGENVSQITSRLTGLASTSYHSGGIRALRSTKVTREKHMKTATVCLALLVLAAPLARAEEKKAAKLDADKLVGTWNYTSGMKRGEKVEGDNLKGDVVITKDTITLKGGPDMTFVIPYKIMGGSPT